MEAAAAGAAIGTAKVYHYNRQNFLEDRLQRLRKEFAQQRYRVAQAGLWREDIRDFVSLTERKMSLYLLVNVLLLSFTINLWCEGRLPEDTPNWLIAGNQLAAVGAFSFLLLTVWLAMQAAVAAQSYQTRVLTQMVRLPIPSWQEMEACRTYGCDFEKLEPRQMFRIPFLMGTQERNAQGNLGPAARAAAGLGGASSSSRGLPEEGAAAEAPPDTGDLPVDPWGLERQMEDTELGCKMGDEVSQLRHFKLIRQASVFWQTYDAFARVSMTLGVYQLMLALTYFVVGYALLEVNSVIAACAGAAVLVGTAEVIACLDLTLSLAEHRLVRAVMAVGPAVLCVAMYIWTLNGEVNHKIAGGLVTISFFSHGLTLGFLTFEMQVNEQDNGAMVPEAFKGVLFLDPFGSVPIGGKGDLSPGGANPQGGTSAGSRTPPSRSLSRSNSEAQLEEGRAGNFSQLTSAGASTARTNPDSEVVSDSRPGHQRPGLGAVSFDPQWHPRPTGPGDFAPSGSASDFQQEPGAPRPDDVVNATANYPKDFWDPVSFMPAEARKGGWYQDMKEPAANPDPKVKPGYYIHEEEASTSTGHGMEAPGLLPWRIFRNTAALTSFAWILAGVQTASRVIGVELTVPDWKHAWQSAMGPNSTLSMMESFSMIHSSFSGMFAATPQSISLVWPYLGMVPKGLSCDAMGHHFLVTDGMSLFIGSKELVHDTAQLRFHQAPLCPELRGQSVQDTALVCHGGDIGSCTAFVLYGNGHQVAACSLAKGAQHGNASSWRVAERWLEEKQEKVSWLFLDDSCRHPEVLGNEKSCASVGTTTGRLVELKVGPRGDELLPLDEQEMDEEVEDEKVKRRHRPDMMRPINERYVGLLLSKMGSIHLLDRQTGGAYAGSALLSLPDPPAAFCGGGNFIYLMGAGAHPSMWRIPVSDKVRAA